MPIVSIGCDNFLGGKEITEHVIKQGRKHFAFLGSASTHAPQFFDRYKGYCQALKNHNLVINENAQFNVFYTEEAGYDAAVKLIESGEKFDAIFAASDLIAIASFTFPPLTTVKQDTQLAGELLVSTLLESINGKETSTTLISPELVIRKSCGN